MIRIRTDRRATLDEMMEAVGNEELLASWTRAHGTDGEESRRLQGAPKAMDSTFSFPCITHFLFGVSPAAMRRMTHSAFNVLPLDGSVQSNASSRRVHDLLPFRTSGMAPLSSQKTGDSFALTFAEHFHRRRFGDCFLRSNRTREHSVTKMIGMRFRAHGGGLQWPAGFQRDEALATDRQMRIDVRSLPQFLDCAEKLQKALGRSSERVSFLVVSDSVEVKRWPRRLLPEKVVTLDVFATHIDKTSSDDTGSKLVDTISEYLLFSLSDAAVLTESGFGRGAVQWNFLSRIFLLKARRTARYPLKCKFSRGIQTL